MDTKSLCVGAVSQDERFGGIAAQAGSVYQSTLGYPPVGEWIHIVATWENGVDCKVYLNYNHQDTRAAMNNEGHPDISIGGLETARRNAIDASISQLRIYSRRLTDADVEQRFQDTCAAYGMCHAVDEPVNVRLPALKFASAYQVAAPC